MEIEFATEETLTVEQLKEQLKEQEAEMLKTIKELKSNIEKAEKKERAERLHKLRTVLINLLQEYGAEVQNTLTEIIETEARTIRGKVVLKKDLEELDLVKYQHLFSRGYWGKDRKTYNRQGVEVKANIPSQPHIQPSFSISPRKYADWYEANHKE